MARAFKSIAVAAARAAHDKKGEDVSVLHVSRSSPITDYLVIVTALSRPHLQSLEQGVEEALEAQGVSCLHRAKPQSDQWRVLDFGGLLVHLMSRETREYYALEKLYHGCPIVSWQEGRTPAKIRKKSARS